MGEVGDGLADEGVGVRHGAAILGCDLRQVNESVELIVQKHVIDLLSGGAHSRARRLVFAVAHNASNREATHYFLWRRPKLSRSRNFA